MSIWSTIGSGLWEGFKDIISAPFTTFSIWWFLAPVLVLWIVLEVYFGKYKSEKLGWNTALANGISLVWINVESMRYLFSESPEPFWTRFFIILLVLCYGIFIVYIAFEHKLSSKAAYALAAPTPIYYLSAITILWSHGVLDINGWVLLDIVLIFPFVMGIIALFKHFLPASEGGGSDIGGGSDMGGGLDSGLGGDSSDMGDFKI